MAKWMLACLAVAAAGAAAAGSVVEVKSKAALDVVNQAATIRPGGNSRWHGHPDGWQIRSLYPR
jgi:hypothetical protein